VSKIHCLSYHCLDDETSGSFTRYEDILNFLKEEMIIIGHNFPRYDMPVIRKILGFKGEIPLIDTLALSWYLYHDRDRHGLEGWGEDFGVPKPKVEDWQNASSEVYVHRCEEDVKINTRLAKQQFDYLIEIYGTMELVLRFCRYITFKMDCVREQEEIGLRLDVPHVEVTLEHLETEKEEKVELLESVMPKIAIKKENIYKNAVEDDNGNTFTKGDLFFSALKDQGKEVIKEKTLEKVLGWEDPNSNSHSQIKAWLYSLGWIPENIKHVRNKVDGTTKQIPQIASKEGGGEVCPSVKKLFVQEPKLEVLEGLSIISHRISIFKAFLKDQVLGRLYASCAGLTNTLRLQHAVVVNLPGFTKKYGKEVRSSIVADEECVLFGCDLSGIEDNTKRHYIFKFDPDYVREMDVPGFDPHLDIAVKAGLLTEEQVLAHKEGKENHKEARQKAKVVNFSATYKVGAKTLARNGGFKESFAKKLLEVFWKRNKAILQVEASLNVKTVNRQQWQQNPVNGYWYSLRNEKDKFSTLNQGTAVYVFDIWVTYLRKLGIKIALQYHDEVLFNVPLDKIEETKLLVQEAMRLTNERLKLNVVIGCSADVGNNYYECH
jgi:hypothetical protein